MAVSYRSLGLWALLAGLISACGSSTPSSISTPVDLSLVMEPDQSVSLATSDRIRVMAANTTSGNQQSYDPGEGIRIFQGLDPDIMLIQEFNYGNNSNTAIREFVDIAFGTQFQFYREGGNEQIPNGVISRHPILQAGEWEDTAVSNRDYAWARIDIPGATDLWVVSVHWLTDDSRRDGQSQELVAYINANVPSQDYLIVGGDFNTDSRPTSELNTLGQVVITDGPFPVDQAGVPGTNASRSKPYDAVYVDGDLDPFEVPVVIGSNSFLNGLVFDSRVYQPLGDVAPVQPGDSGAVNMQHMAVIRDFSFSDSPTISGPPLEVPGQRWGRLTRRDDDNPTRPGSAKDDYSLTGVSPGQQVQISLSSRRFDAYLQLIDGSTGAVIAANDDADGTDSALQFTVSGGIPYGVRVTSFGEADFGFYRLLAQ